MEIAGASYDLEKGGLFLVSTREGSPKVEQLPIEVVDATIPNANEKLEKLAKTGPGIAAFVGAAAKGGGQAAKGGGQRALTITRSVKALYPPFGSVPIPLPTAVDTAAPEATMLP